MAYNGFRELNSEELSFVAGGSYSPTTGWHIQGARQYGGGGGGGGGGGLWGGGYAASGCESGSCDNQEWPESDCEVIDIDAFNLTGDLTDADIQAIDAVEQAVERLLGALANEQVDSKVSYGGNSFTAAEFNQLLSHMDMKLYNPGHDYGNDISPSVQGGGGADRNNGDPVLSVNIDVLRDRGLTSPESAMFYILHEIVHTTQQFWDDRAPANSTESQRVSVELATNAAAKGLADLLGINLHGYSPPLGYPGDEASVTHGSGALVGASGGC